MDINPDTSNQAAIWIEHRDGRVSVEEQSDGRRRIVVHPQPGTFVSRAECVTRYPVDLIRRLVQVKAPSYVCDEIARDEDADYLGRSLRYALLGYLPVQAFGGGRLLDFGSGSGASTVVLARMLSDTEIVGVELEPEFISIAEMRAHHYGLSNVAFLQSPDPKSLPSGLGTFNFVNLGAVYEHLLPDERPKLLTQLWNVLEVGGVIFVNQLPYRFFPLERHTTGLPLVNYLPDRLAYEVATRFSPRVNPDVTWAELLRTGIRGGTARSVRRDLLRGGGRARMLTPTMMGLRDHSDLWYELSMWGRDRLLKLAMRAAFRAASRVSAGPVAPGLSLAFEKLA